MSIDITMPKLSDTMEEGKILRWLKKPGEKVSVGDVLAEVETDKADMELEAEKAGILREVLVEEGGSVSVGQVIARLSAAGEAAESSEPSADAKQAAPRAPSRAPEPPKPEPSETGTEEEDGAEIRGSGPGGRVVKRDLHPTRPSTPPPPRAAPRIVPPSPSRHPTPRPVPGASAPSAPRPADTASAASASRPSPAPPPDPKPTPSGRESLSKIRRTVARRMAESKREIPHFYVTAEIDMTECVRLKASLATARPDVSISYTHFLLRAVALALGENPRINARYAGEEAIEYSDGIHLGIAVALDEGLIVPVLHACESKSVFEIATEARALVERVRSGKAEGGDLSGGTFTVSNLGMYPIEEFAAVINPPQAAVLAVGSLRERPVAREGAITTRQTMRVTLSSDHRVIDGAEAARFLETLKGLLENAVRLVI